MMRNIPSNRFRILIVDDDLDSLASVSDILDDVGFDTYTASSGEQALTRYFEGSADSTPPAFDLCVLDFKMPGMDGVQLYEEMRKLTPDMRAILLTAYAGDDGISRAKRAGTWKVLRKPVDVQLLLELIRTVLE